jgi:hypothetical protein
MPVLRQAPDNTLAETLGGLGNSLTQAFNPLNQIRANNMVSEMQQRQWEMTHAQTLDVANRNAADVFVRTFDGILPPGVVASEGARIRAGQGNIEGAVNAAKALGTWQGNQAAAKMIDADPEMAGWDAADKESVKARVLNGESLISAKQAHATQKQDELKLTTTQGGVASATTPLAKEAAGAGQPKTASELDAADRVSAAAASIDPTAPDAKAKIDKLNADNLAAGYGRPPLGTALQPSLQPSADSEAASRAAETKRREDVAEVEVEGMPRTGNILPGPLPGSPGNTADAPYNPTPTPAPVVSADGTVTPATKDVFLPNTESPASLPVPVERTLPGGRTIVGETESEAQARQKTDTETTSGVKDDIGAGESGQNMMALLDRLNTLADLSGTATTGGQFSAAVLNKLREYHIVATNRAGLLAEMQSLFQAQIPELRKAMGVKFEAGPELSAQGKMIGDASLPVEVLKGIFARQATVAKLGIGLRDLAIRASQPGQAKPLTRADYLAQRAALYDNLTNEMRQQIKDYGGYSKETLAPPTPPPATSGNSIMDAIHALVRWGAGDQSQTPVQQSAPNANEVWDVDANGHPFRR